MTDSNAQHIIDRLKAAGMSPAGIAGIMGNLMAESNFNPLAQNPNGAYGIAQWMGPRTDALRAYAASTGGKMDSLDTQLGFLVKESTDMGTWQKMVNAKSASDAATIWEQEYERAGSGPDVHMPERISTANQIFKDLNISGFDWSAFNPLNIPGEVAGAVEAPFRDVASAIGATFGGVKTVTDALTSTTWWKRIGIGLAGILLIILAANEAVREQSEQLYYQIKGKGTGSTEGEEEETMPEKTTKETEIGPETEKIA